MNTKFLHMFHSLCVCATLLFSTSLFSETGNQQELLTLMTVELPKIINDHPQFYDQFLQVKPLEDGGPSFINSVYQIDLLNGSALILKIENSVWKKDKTCNEVIALKFLRSSTSIPVPNVVAYCDDSQNSALKNEYILMAKSEGKPLNQEIGRLYQDKDKYHKILNQLASIIAEIKTFRFTEIGSIFESCPEASSLKIGGIVDFADYKVATPCTSYSEYAKHALRYYICEMENLVKKSNQDREIYQRYIPILKDLLEITDFHFLNDHNEFVFSHQDFVMKNILVDDDVVTAVLDWEWSGSALLEIESLTGFDFLLNEEDQVYFANALQNKGCPDLFAPIPQPRKTFYKFIGNVYTLVAFREWQEGKFHHTAKFLSQKLEQRKIKSNANFNYDDFLIQITQELDQCILELKNF